MFGCGWGEEMGGEDEGKEIGIYMDFQYILTAFFLPFFFFIPFYSKLGEDSIQYTK